MTKIKIEIKNRWTGTVIFSYEKEGNTLKDTIAEYVRQATESDSRADLTDADLTDADLTDANLTRANLTPIKEDFFVVLLRAIPETKYLRQNLIEGKIDGSTYDGECSCLSGTLARCATVHNGPRERFVMDGIMSCRNSSRPIERFFMNIKKGDTPETNNCSKLALEWLDEFEAYL